MADENVAVQLNDGGRIRLSGKDIKNEKDDAVVLVNMNRLYLKQVRIIQKKYTSDKEREEAEKVLHVINTTLRKIPDERQMFVDMSVKDVKFCFHNELVNLPANSFRKINMCKCRKQMANLVYNKVA